MWARRMEDRNEEVGATETKRGGKQAIMSCCTININHNNKWLCACVNSSLFHLLHSGESYLTLNTRSPHARTRTCSDSILYTIVLYIVQTDDYLDANTCTHTHSALPPLSHSGSH